MRTDTPLVKIILFIGREREHTRRWQNGSYPSTVSTNTLAVSKTVLFIGRQREHRHGLRVRSQSPSARQISSINRDSGRTRHQQKIFYSLTATTNTITVGKTGFVRGPQERSQSPLTRLAVKSTDFSVLAWYDVLTAAFGDGDAHLRVLLCQRTMAHEFFEPCNESGNR